MAHQYYHYAFDAARLLEQCQMELDEIEKSSSTYRIRRGFSSSSVHNLRASLSTTADLLCKHFQQLLEYETAGGGAASSTSNIQEEILDGGIPSSLSSCVDLLETVTDAKQRAREEDQVQQNTSKDVSRPYCPIRNATDSLLFRLVVKLQLCLVRIDDGRWVLTGRRRRNRTTANETNLHSQLAFGLPLILTGSLGISAFLVTQNNNINNNQGRLPLIFNATSSMENVSLVSAVTKAGVAAMTASLLRVAWRYGWMSTKMYRSRRSINEWNRQWRLVQSTTSSVTDLRSVTNPTGPDRRIVEKQSQKLIEDAVRRPPKSFLLQSQGELRFLMLKRAMDVFYASVDTAMKVAKGRSEPDWQLSLVTAAAASFYSLTGASKRAAEVTSSSSSACQLIQNSWGIVSTATVKNISLQASRLIKGAAVADLIEINGVSCFVLSADPAPELTVAIETFKRRYKPRNAIPTLSTINEQEEHEPAATRTSVSKPFACSQSLNKKRDVIFHLTGGGFFAHIIASDLPYLLDWSSSTGAVIICPEYGLLPQHTFPVALDQCTAVYRSLMQEGFTVNTLGFEVSRIVVTGESAGGNLAAALCVRIGQDLEKNATSVMESHEKVNGQNGGPYPTESNSALSVGMPDALMLSCPVLDMSLDLTPSRVLGNNDPVLPSGLISAISDAYVPPRLGISKKHPLASPIYASDTILSKFPPTLLIASSNDPLLDDSVAFNQRLHSLSVESRLRAAVNMPHAYLGLGTAGFPEAVQVQMECQRWLAFQFTRILEKESSDTSSTALTDQE